MSQCYEFGLHASSVEEGELDLKSMNNDLGSPLVKISAYCIANGT